MNRLPLPRTHSVVKSILLALSIALAGHAMAADADDPQRVPKLFESDENLAVTVTAPWGEITGNRKNQDPYPATVEYTDHTGKRVSHRGTVERRGVKRQQACRFPPIKLRFEKEAVKDSLFRGQQSLKMVTHCQSSERYDQYYILEMMAYRMYNEITDYSFLVRPLTITYRDSDNGETEEPRFAFLIEDDSDVAKRNGLKKLEVARTSPSRLDLDTASDMSLFQYMIGNTDWSPLIGPDPKECCHNIKLIAPRPLQDDDTIWPVAYDFDSTGLVDPPYAAPPENLGVRSITQRVYRGYCALNAGLPDARAKAISMEADIMAVLDSDPRLEDRPKKKAATYLEKYFDTLKDDRDFERLIVKKCRK